MTDRLSPSQWRDLATFWTYWVGDARVSKMMMDHAGHMEGAARREAEQPQGPLAGIEAGPDAVHPKPPIDGLVPNPPYIGPGSDGARKHDWDCRNARPCVCLRCGATATTPRDDAEPCLAKPAPAADDLVKRLRGRVSDDWDICERAADRIEALTVALANCAGDMVEAQARVAELEYANDKQGAAINHAEARVVDQEREIAGLLADMTALEARVARLQDLAIWMTGCGYDFTQHPYYMQSRHLLTGAEANDAA